MADQRRLDRKGGKFSFKRETGTNNEPYDIVEIFSNNVVKITDGKSSLKKNTIDLTKFITFRRRRIRT